MIDTTHDYLRGIQDSEEAARPVDINRCQPLLRMKAGREVTQPGWQIRQHRPFERFAARVTKSLSTMLSSVW